MTVDLSTARVGCEVTTHAGAKLVIDGISKHPTLRRWVVTFKGYHEEMWHFHRDGSLRECLTRPMDIVSITDPPLTDAKRLAEIAKIVRAASGIFDMNPWADEKRIEILALAEGRAP